MATYYEVTLSDIDKMIRDIKYPPLNGGPTEDDITGMLNCCADIIYDLTTEAYNSAEIEDHAEELESAVTDAADGVEDVIADIYAAINEGSLQRSPVILELISDLDQVLYKLRGV